MSEATKKKANLIGNNFYRLIMSASVLTLLFNGGAWKQGIEAKAFESVDQKFEVIEVVKENESDLKEIRLSMKDTAKDIQLIREKQIQFEGDVKQVLKAIKDLDTKINRISEERRNQ